LAQSESNLFYASVAIELIYSIIKFYHAIQYFGKLITREFLNYCLSHMNEMYEKQGYLRSKSSQKQAGPDAPELFWNMALILRKPMVQFMKISEKRNTLTAAFNRRLHVKRKRYPNMCNILLHINH